METLKKTLPQDTVKSRVEMMCSLVAAHAFVLAGVLDQKQQIPVYCYLALLFTCGFMFFLTKKWNTWLVIGWGSAAVSHSVLFSYKLFTPDGERFLNGLSSLVSITYFVLLSLAVFVVSVKIATFLLWLIRKF